MLKQKNYFIKKDGLGHLFYFITSSINVKSSFKESVLSLTFRHIQLILNRHLSHDQQHLKQNLIHHRINHRQSIIFGFHQIYRLQTFNFITIGNMRYLLNNFSEAMTATETLATAAMLKPIPILLMLSFPSAPLLFSILIITYYYFYA